jgi:hypothetical protein
MLAAVYRAAHAVPAVGFLIAGLLAAAWWKIRASESPVMHWLALGLGVLAVFFAVVALAGFVLILVERPTRRRRERRE